MPTRAERTLINMQRREEVCRLHGVENRSFESIAGELGITRQAAWRIWRKVVDTAGQDDVRQFRADQVRATNLRIAELLQRARKPGISDRDFAAIYAEITKAQDLLAKLAGTFMPTRREVSVITQDVVDREIERLTREHAGVAAEARTAGMGVDDMFAEG
jgi:hypothetical protein